MAGNEEQQHKHPQSALAGVENGAEWQENNLAEQAHEHGRQCGERIELALAFAFVLFADGIRRSSYMVGEGRDQSVGRQRWDGSGGTATVDYLIGRDVRRQVDFKRSRRTASAAFTAPLGARPCNISAACVTVSSA